MADGKDPSNADILTALQGMWRQQGDLVKGVETRLGARIDAAIQGVEARLESKVDAVAQRLDQRLTVTAEQLAERMAKEIQDRPVVVHIDMSRVSELEKQVSDLAKRVADLEARNATH